ncbi:MAG TPA: hypothetical protein VG672_06500, partial [Bryobacteraceae bacterium]|nr:hypothetical protein [Bryobacteraceae bacterium]
MPICLNCSAAFEGYVCQKCGAPQHRPGPAPLTGKLMGPVAWLIAAIVAAGAILGVLAIGVGISLIRHLPSSMDQSRRRDHDANLALARLLTSTHLELEVLSIDPGSSTVTLRHRHTGSIVTQDIESARKGNFLFGTVASTLPVPAPHQARPPFGV